MAVGGCEDIGTLLVAAAMIALNELRATVRARAADRDRREMLARHVLEREAGAAAAEL